MEQRDLAEVVACAERAHRHAVEHDVDLASSDEIEAIAGRAPLDHRRSGRDVDALEARHPTLRGTIREHGTLRRRAFVRFFACERDLSHEPPDAPLPDAVAAGTEPLLVVGAMAGG